MTETQTVKTLSVDGIVPADTNRAIDAAGLKELTESIKEKGVLSPILVRPRGPKYEVVYGERRLKAAKAAGLGEIPAIVRELSEAEADEIRITENLQRKDLHPIEEAEGYERLQKLYGYSTEDIAIKVGKPRSHVYVRMKFAQLPKEAKTAFRKGLLTPTTALLIARMPAELQPQVTKALTKDREYKILDTPMTVGEARRIVEYRFLLKLSDAPFSRSDTKLVEAAGACTVCPKRTGNQKELFDDVKSADICTDGDCYKRKTEAQWIRIKKDAKSMGYEKILSDSESKKVFPPYYDTPDQTTGYVDVKAQCHELPYGSTQYGKTWSQLLDKAVRKGEVGLIVARDRDKRIRTLIRKKDGLSKLKELGVIQEAKRESNPRTAEETARRKRFQLHKRAALEGIARACANLDVTAEGMDAATKKADAEFWNMVGTLAQNAIGSLTETQVRKRRDAAKLKNTRSLGIELLLTETVTVGMGVWQASYPKPLVEAMKYFGMDLKKIEAEIRVSDKVVADMKKAKRAKGRKK